ncbi:MAG: zinc-finger domain-containing protein [Rhodobacterales bacterium]|nr:zinc-finger domain-containing protein [Rhodobacterales bacterium]
MVTQAPEIRIVDEYHIACDGSGPSGGHPRVWLQIPAERGWVECGYCDCKIVHRDFVGKV